MSWFQRLVGNFKKVLPKISEKILSAAASGTLTAAASAAFEAGKGVLGKFKSKEITPPSNISELPAFAESIAGLAKDVFTKVRTPMNNLANVLFATGISNPEAAIARMNVIGVGTAGARMTENAETAYSLLNPVLSEETNEIANSLASANFDRSTTSSATVVTDDQLAVVDAMVKDTTRQYLTYAAKSDLAPFGVVTTGDKKKWYLCDRFINSSWNTGATNGLEAAPSISNGRRTYAVTEANQKRPGAWVSPANEFAYRLEARTMPKDDCYKWKTELIFGYEVTLDANLSTYGSAAIAVSVNGGTAVEYPLVVPTAVQTKTEGILRVNVDPTIANLVDFALVTVTPNDAATVVLSLYGSESVGILKTGHNTCSVTHVSYWDGEEEMMLSANTNWLDLFGKIDRVSNDPDGDCDDPNLTVTALWQGIVGDPDKCFRLLKAIDVEMTTVLGNDNNHNTLSYAQYGTTLSAMANIESWIYTDGPMNNLSKNQIDELITLFSEHMKQIPALVAAHSSVRQRLFKVFTVDSM